MLPKFNLLYYKALLDNCFVKFFELHNDDFQKIGNQYVLSRTYSNSKIKNEFKKLLIDELKPILKPYSILEPNYYLIIGACMPKDNLLLKYKDGYFPEKLSKAICSDFPLKYLLKEKDIKIDLVKFNEILINLFDSMFKSTRNVLRAFGDNMNNVIFIKHKNLDCYSMFKTIKYIYGKNNCWNLYKEKFSTKQKPLVALNDMIDLYVLNKIAMNRSTEFKSCVAEVKLFIDERIFSINEQLR